MSLKVLGGWSQTTRWIALAGVASVAAVGLLISVFSEPAYGASSSSSSSSSSTMSFEAETMSSLSGRGTVFGDSRASAYRGMGRWTSGFVSKTITTPSSAGSVVIRARGDQCYGSPIMRIRIDGVAKGTWGVSTRYFSNYSTGISPLPAGTHTITVQYINEARTSTCDRNLYLDKIELVASPPKTTSPPTTPPPTSTPPTSQPSDAALLKSYVVQDSWPQYGGMKYAPRQFAAGLDVDLSTKTTKIDSPGPYAGWDVLSTPNSGAHTYSNRTDWLTLQLNRPAKLAVVWRAGIPLPKWLGDANSGWARGEDVTVNGKAAPTYTKSFPAGEVKLGGVYDPGSTSTTPKNTYPVLFAESDGTPPAAPAVSAGLETPEPNQTCPQWVHDRYETKGPDGKSYATWHPQIDPVYWCYFNHEHGSDPSLLKAGYKPAFGYTAAAHGMAEPHVGFKSYAFDDLAGQKWLVTQHFGTSGLARACNRFHTVDIAVADKASGKLLADLRFMGDFGKAITFETDEPLTPTACPDQARKADADGSRGNRKLSPASTFTGTGYEPWRAFVGQTVFGFEKDSFTMSTPSFATMCKDLVCDQGQATGEKGEFRHLSVAGFGINSARAKATGEFYTNPQGTALVASDTSGAVKQYISPGMRSTVAPSCNDSANSFHLRVAADPWQSEFVCGSKTKDIDLERALALPN